MLRETQINERILPKELAPGLAPGYNSECPACVLKKCHTEEQFETYHPLARHGFTRETGWTHPALVLQPLEPFR